MKTIKQSAPRAQADPILVEHATAIRALGKAVGDIIEIGRLADCKEKVGHGNWLPWLKREFGWSAKTAENFMNVAGMAAGKFVTVTNLDLDMRSLYLLAAPSTPDEARTEVLARAEAGEKVTVEDVKQSIAKTKGTTARKTRAAPKTPTGATVVQLHKQPPAAVDPAATLSRTAQQKLEAAIRQHKQQLAAEFRHVVADEVRRRMDEIILPHWKQQIEQAKELYGRRIALMDKATFNKIRRGLHPDSRNSISDKALAEAFDAFMALEKFLLDEKDSPTTFGDLPSSAADWEARREEVMAARRHEPRDRNALPAAELPATEAASPAKLFVASLKGKTRFQIADAVLDILKACKTSVHYVSQRNRSRSEAAGLTGKVYFGTVLPDSTPDKESVVEPAADTNNPTTTH